MELDMCEEMTKKESRKNKCGSYTCIVKIAALAD